MDRIGTTAWVAGAYNPHVPYQIQLHLVKPLEVFKVLLGELGVRTVEEDDVDWEKLVVLEFDKHLAGAVAGRVTVLRREVYEAVAPESLYLYDLDNYDGQVFNCNKENLSFTFREKAVTSRYHHMVVTTNQ